MSTKIVDILLCFSCFVISHDKNFTLLLAYFGLIFTRSLTLLSLVFLPLYHLIFPVALEENLILSQESLLIFYIPNKSISELNVNRQMQCVLLA